MLCRISVLFVLPVILMGTAIDSSRAEWTEPTPCQGYPVQPISFGGQPAPSDLQAEIAALSERMAMMEKQAGPTEVKLSEPESRRGNWLLSIDYLNWDLHRRGTDFAIGTDANAISVGTGSVYQVDADHSSGVRAALGYRTSVGAELVFGYTYYQNSSSSFAQAPVGGNLWATRSHPNQNEEADTADALSSFACNVFDCDLRYPLVRDCPLEARIFGGVRFVDIDQDLQITYDGADFYDALVLNSSRMSGFGCRLGGEALWHMSSSWSLVGNFAGSVVYGRFKNHLYETNLGGADVIVDVTDHYEQAVPVLETALALAWRRGPLEIRSGYEMAAWLNLAGRSMFVDNTHDGAYLPSSTDVLLEGFFVRGVWEY